MVFEFRNFDDLPDGLRQIIQDQMEGIDKAHMEMDERSRSVKRFFEEMDVDGLIVLSSIFDNIAQSGNPSAMAAFYSGRLSGLLEFKHNVCSVQGINHDEEKLKSFSSPDETVNNDADITPGGAKVPPGDQYFESTVADEEYEEDEGYLKDDDEPLTSTRGLMKKYRVTPDGGDEKLKCIDCGYMYVSLEDRMVKAPDDCPGCYLKSAHG